MPADSNQNTNKQEEIDLLTLMVKAGKSLGKLFRNLINLLGSALVFLLRKWYYFALALILAGISSFVTSRITDSYFHSHLTIRTNATRNQPIMSSLDKLGDYATEGNYTALANELDLSIEDASQIIAIENFWFYDIGKDGIIDGIDTKEKFLSDTSVVKIGSEFNVTVAVYNSEILDNLEKGLEYYLDTNPFLQALNEQRIIALETKRDQIEYEIEKLDSLQKREYYTNPDDLRQKEGQLVFTAERDVRMYHQDMLFLLQMKQDCERDINLYGNVVTITEGFGVPAEPDNGLIHYVKLYTWRYLGLALLLSLIISFRKKIWIR